VYCDLIKGLRQIYPLAVQSLRTSHISARAITDQDKKTLADTPIRG
jgi:hypothetical protein